MLNVLAKSILVDTSIFIQIHIKYLKTRRGDFKRKRNEHFSFFMHFIDIKFPIFRFQSRQVFHTTKIEVFQTFFIDFLFFEFSRKSKNTLIII